MIGALLTTFLAWIGVTRNLAWFDQRVTLEDAEIIGRSSEVKLKVSEQYYQINAPIEAVYQAYTTGRPTDLWPEKWIIFHFLLLPNSRARKGIEDFPKTTVVGSRVFVELLCRPLHRWLKLMVGVEVTALEEEHQLRYDYLEGSVTMGYNIIFFKELSGDSGERYTQIHHYSEYRGTSLLLRLIMPLFQKSLHVGFVDALHTGMKEKIERSYFGSPDADPESST
jgi:hypothetical protein